MNSENLNKVLQSILRLIQKTDFIQRFATMKQMPKDQGADNTTISVP